jgi:hypothetical protein
VKASRRPQESPAGSRPLTLRAMLAADCSSLPARLRHLIHVLALHADNRTGRGLSGQARLARYLGVSDRQLRRYVAELEAAWAAGRSPVGIIREARFNNSDRYTLVVREDAPLVLPEGPSPLSGPRVVRTPVSTTDRTPMTGTTGHRRPMNRSPMSGQPPSEPDTSVHLSTLFPSTEGTTELERNKVSSAPGGADAPARRPETTESASGAEASQLAAALAYGAKLRARLEGKG